MDPFNKKHLDILLEEPAGWCVSIYLPVHPTGREAQQDPIRLKNLLNEASDQMIALGLRSPEADALLEPAQALLSNPDFWRHQNKGLAIFCSEDRIYCYRLPIKFMQQIVVAERFMVKPLLPLLNGDEQYYLLTLSQNQVRLYRGSRFDIQEVEIDDVPASLSEALRFDDPEKQLQFQTPPRTSRAGGESSAIFHGHGAGRDETKTDLRHYFLQVDRSLGNYLDANQAPLILAGVDYLLPIYQEANTYPDLIVPGIEGNPEEFTLEELHAQAWQIISPYFQQGWKTALERYGELKGSGGGLASNDLLTILSAAEHGRVDTLFVAVDVQQWGMVSDQGQLELFEEYRPGADELLDLAAARTLTNSGQVYPVPSREISGQQSSLAAIFRYSLPG